MAFAHLHVHSQFTLLNGVNTPKELAKAAKDRGMDALAITDGANLYGTVELTKAAKDYGIHPVIGAELWVDPRGLSCMEGKLEPNGFQVVLLAEDEAGYQNLCALITRAIFDGLWYRPRVDLALLEQHSKGLFCLTGTELGVIRRNLPEEQNLARLDRLGGIFGAERLYAELSDQGLPWQPDWCRLVRQLAAQRGLQTVVTNDVRYVDPKDVCILETLNCVAAGATLDDKNRARHRTDQQYLKTEAELRAIFPQDGEALDRTRVLAELCHYKFPSKIYYFPASTPPDREADADTDANWRFFFDAFPPSREFRVPDPRPPGAGSLNGYFAWYSRAGLEKRLELVDPARHAAYWERLEAELKMIVKMGFAAYLLIVAEFINWAKDRGIPVGPGRGSAAGSLVAWAMRITDIDPLRFQLLFERFLNPERVSMPDIDVDFAQDRREEVIEHVRVKYGTELVSQIITFGKLQAKAALKDVARTAELSFQEADRLAKLIPAQLNITLADALAQEPKILELCKADPRMMRVVKMAQQVEGITRQTGVHAAGVVIADRPLVRLAPLYRDSPEGGPVVQYDMKSAESIGLIKFDFLGLKTLDQIRDAVAMVERNTGQKIEIGRIPEDSPEAYALLSKGDGLGVFQVESSGMRELLTRMKPNCLDDLVALVALYRPGPLSSGMVDDFIDRKHGKKLVVYPFAELESILGNTYGTIVYQEQVMQCAQVLAGYSLGEADMLRRAMGKKDAAEMAKQKTRFVSGAIAKGHDEQKTSDLFDLLAKFAEYGFNKSHSAAYGYIAYQTAWLKAHHRAEHMASLMTMDAGDTDKLVVYIGDCRKAGIRILPPDLRHSVSGFEVPREDRRSIRYGLCGIKGMGESAIVAILEARDKSPFTDFMDFLGKVDSRRVNKKVLEVLIKAGAMDCFGLSRARMANVLEDAMSAAAAEQERKASGQVSLFGAAQRPQLKIPEVPDWPLAERLRNEKDALGLFLSGHPVEEYSPDAERMRLMTIDRLSGGQSEKEVGVLGMVSSLRVIKTKKGDKMAFALLEDLQGSVEAVFFPEAFIRSQAALASEQPVVVRGKLERKEDGVKILADSAELAETVRERNTNRILLKIPTGVVTHERVSKLKELLQQNKGRCDLRLSLQETGNFQAPMRLESWKVAPTRTVKNAIRALFADEAEVRFE
jgi:DNA polymerase III subunit alpha